MKNFSNGCMRATHLVGAPGLALVVAMCAGNAVAQVDASSQAGSNYARAFSLFGLTGAGVPVGIIEVGGGAPTVIGGVTYDQAGFGIISSGTDNLGGVVGTPGTRLKGQWNFTGATLPPPANPTVITPTAANGSWHATLVSSVIASNRAGGFKGVARGADVFLATWDGTGTTSDRSAVSWLNTEKSIKIFNFSYGGAADAYGNNTSAAYFDQQIWQKDLVIVKSAGNSGTGFDPVAGGNASGGSGNNRISQPGEFFNGITVGATDESMQARRFSSSYWNSGDSGAAPDNRAKPDILAPGSQIGNDGIAFPNGDRPGYPAGASSGTSFAAPQVTGTVALLQQDGLALGNVNGNSNHLLAKSVILNSARKRGIIGENFANGTSLDNSASGAQASDDDYLNGGLLRMGAQANAPANATRNWNPSQWAFGFDNLLQRDIFRTNAPLDDEQGVGLLDSARALTQWRAGQQFPVGMSAPIGWDLRNIPISGPTADYKIGVAIPAGSFITATLTWDRRVLDMTGTITPQPIAIFDLRILYQGNFIAVSQCRTDSLQHLHIPAPFDGAPGDYTIEVYYLSGGDFNTQYSVSWWTVPSPSGTVLLAMAGLLAARRRRA